MQALKLLVIIGLPFGLVLAITMIPRTNFGIVPRLVVMLSKYRNLLPYMIAQAKHETGNFTSNVYRTHNNLFGMKHPTIRKAVGEQGNAAPDGGHYQRYASDTDSVRDLLLWFDARKFPTSVSSPDEYVNQLHQRAYFGDAIANYLKGVKHFLA